MQNSYPGNVIILLSLTWFFGGFSPRGAGIEQLWVKMTPLGGDGPHATCLIIIEKGHREKDSRTDRQTDVDKECRVRLSLIREKEDNRERIDQAQVKLHREKRQTDRQKQSVEGGVDGVRFGFTQRTKRERDRDLTLEWAV